MLSDKDYELLDEVFQKLKQADNTCSDVVLDPEEVRVLVDEFDDFNHELVEIKKIIDEFEEEIKRFTDDLIKNFSLTNVIESVTILNPKPLLNIVEKSIHKLEREQQRLIHPRILIGLYVHVCCFVERMVKHEPIKSYPNLIEFEKEQSDFIENVLNSFDELQSHYSIEIPTSEIGYIYDYINMLNVEDKNTYVDE